MSKTQVDEVEYRLRVDLLLMTGFYPLNRYFKPTNPKVSEHFVDL